MEKETNKTAEEFKAEIAEKLNLLALKTHTYNCDACLEDILDLISQQSKEKDEEIKRLETLVKELSIQINQVIQKRLNQ